MKAILIDPKAETVTEVKHNGDYKQIYKLIDCELFTVLQIDDVNSIYIDDEGLLNDPKYFFNWRGYGQPLANKGLVLGCDEEGDTIGTTLSVEEVRAKVTFSKYSVLGFDPLPADMKTGPDHPMGEGVPIIGHVPVFGPPMPDDDK
jgi:hypothetical protein